MPVQKIEIDFEILKTGNPETLIVCDTSVWAHIEESPAIIEIYLPTGKIVVYSHVKGRNTVFNSSNLLLSDIGKKDYLPDGIYKIAIKGSPDTFFKERSYIRTEKLQLEVDSLYSEFGLNFNNIPKNTISLLDKVNFMIRGAESAMRRDEKKSAVNFYKEARRLIDEYNNCKDC